MRISYTLHKYIIQEILPIFLVSLLVFMVVVLATEMMTITEWMVKYKVSLLHIAFIVICLLPEITLLSLPAAMLISVIAAFTRFSSDNEIIALKSSGISLYQILPPVLILSALAGCLALSISLYVAPWGSQSFRAFTMQILKSKMNIGLKERVFTEPVEDVFFYINSISFQDNTMKDIFVLDKREDTVMTNTIVAKRGKLFYNSKNSKITVHFEDGTVFITEHGLASVRSIQFKTYALNIDLEEMLPVKSDKKREPEEMYLGELWKARSLGKAFAGRDQYNRIVLELMERFTVPLAVFLMGLVGASLGSQVKASGRVVGGTIGLLVFLVYYFCWAGFRSMSETGVVPPAIGPWVPVVLLLISSVYLMKQAVHERSLVFLGRFGSSRPQPGAPRPSAPIGPRSRAVPRPYTAPDREDRGGEPEETPTVPLEAVPETLAPSERGRYVANTRTKKYHAESCPWAAAVASKDQRRFFRKEEAEAAGYVPCKVCKPGTQIR